MQSMRWLPLEANPDVMNQFLKQLGVGTSWQFVDVYGLDPELLSLVPRPVCGLLLLFPVTEKYEHFRAAEEETIKSHGQDVDSSVYFMKQTISNACGTIGLIHAVANNRDKLSFESDSALKKFLDDSTSLSPEERAKFLEKDESIRVTHESSAQDGQTEAPSIDDKVDLHFVAFVHLQGHLYELDGRKPFPVNHGKTSEDTLLECFTGGSSSLLDDATCILGLHSNLKLLAKAASDAIEVCRKFMQRDPDELRFTVVAFSKA